MPIHLKFALRIKPHGPSVAGDSTGLFLFVLGVEFFVLFAILYTVPRGFSPVLQFSNLLENQHLNCFVLSSISKIIHGKINRLKYQFNDKYYKYTILCNRTAISITSTRKLHLKS